MKLILDPNMIRCDHLDRDWWAGWPKKILLMDCTLDSLFSCTKMFFNIKSRTDIRLAVVSLMLLLLKWRK